MPPAVPPALLEFSASILSERFSLCVTKTVFTFSFDRYQMVTPQLLAKLEVARATPERVSVDRACGQHDLQRARTAEREELVDRLEHHAASEAVSDEARSRRADRDELRVRTGH